MRAPREDVFRGQTIYPKRYGKSGVFMFVSRCEACGREVHVTYSEREYWDGLCAVCHVDRLANHMTAGEYKARLA